MPLTVNITIEKLVVSHTTPLFTFRPALNGLRGAAILMVMVFHATPHFLIGGFIGVDIFFVLSGFLITTLLIREYDAHQQPSLTNFYMRRLLRLGPALIFMLVIFSCASLIFLPGERQTQFLVDAGITLFYFSNWARAFGIHPPDFLGHTWSLAIEEQFYLFWPLVLLIMMKHIKSRTAWLSITLCLAASAAMWRFFLLPDATPMRLYNGLDTRADALMLGCALAIALSIEHIRRYIQFKRLPWLSVIAGMSAAGLLLFSVYGHWDSPPMFQWGYLLIAALSVIVIADLMQDHETPLKRLLSTQWLVWVGSISYGLYLWHFPVYRVLLETGMTPGAVLACGSLITLLVSAGSWYFIERNLLTLKQKFQPTSAASPAIGATHGG